jgi:GNAT superfamily N-acetyltransferase
VAAGDRELLFEIYASTRQEELAPLDWDASVREAFLRQQFQAQDTYYQQVFTDATHDLILDGEGNVLGRLYLNRGERVFLVVDIALLPAQRGRGIGTRLLRDFLDEADAAGRPVQVHVERFNPARRLYERLGFRQIEDLGIYLLLERHQPNGGT